MLCYIGCGTEIFDIEIDPRDGKIMPCPECQRVIKDTYLGLLSSEEKHELNAIDYGTQTLEDIIAVTSTQTLP